ncbi:hypothetical protein ASPVEDRAFT_143778 [Aspergillus versicolor CBS 583.65]|uniref:ABM domain-containing protein n=1 Tax=Aspergillus versicolor CBS 583.65 TaxID=1036611 RepID=A0A1L9Q3L1_ASPVE|nr:uncharacterized protein ASPVEDRAFT_143778 [Aspergillus versicolor CBS 583.65]OJJ08341.1 hypothetical protein ASPVEDRAFT_143778 [Aspergillus versicolor CBS 583.65]
MTITELLWPVFKSDPQLQAEFAAKSPEIFAHFVGVAGLKDFFRGQVIFDNDVPVDKSSCRGALILEWDDVSSMHAFFPHSETFRSFISLVKPYVAGPDIPQLFEAVVSAVPCAETGVTQVLKVSKGPGTETVWIRLQEVIAELYGNGKPLFACANGVEKEESVFLGIVGWRRVEDYERSRTVKAITALLRELGSRGEVFNVVVQLERMAV